MAPSFSGGGGSGGGGYPDTFYENYGNNEFVSTEDETSSTFGMDVDTASYTIVRKYLNDGNMPEPDSVRTEEFVNYFDHPYAEPQGDDIFSISIEGAGSHFGAPDYHLLKIGIKSEAMQVHERQPANIVFVIDTSGSMGSGNRLELVKDAIHILSNGLQEGDKIGLVEYGSYGSIISGLTPDISFILNSVDALNADGSTNAEEGLKLAYDVAREGFEANKINRVILCSDGVANVGVTGPDAILEAIKTDADKGITLTTLGFGMGNYNDILLEQLANDGDGNYFYIDTITEAERLFSEGALRILVTLGFDAKVQVNFNPAAVDMFRLIGYENRLLDEEDFEDNTVDSGDIGPNQAVTALYEVMMNPEADSGSTAATVKVRCTLPDGETIEQYENTIDVNGVLQSFDNASRDFRFTASVVEFAEILKESPFAEDGTFQEILSVAGGIAVDDDQAEFIELVNKAIELSD
jgi:Ca-activated chloride channel family protein